MDETNLRCPSCGEHFVIWELHDDGKGNLNTHQYCKNCDWGTCDDC